MNAANVGTATEPFSDGNKDRRIVSDRRISHGRRDMIRFDVTGGDRRSGNARRITDEGLRESYEED